MHTLNCPVSSDSKTICDFMTRRTFFFGHTSENHSAVDKNDICRSNLNFVHITRHIAISAV